MMTNIPLSWWDAEYLEACAKVDRCNREIDRMALELEASPDGVSEDFVREFHAALDRLHSAHDLRDQRWRTCLCCTEDLV